MPPSASIGTPRSWGSCARYRGTLDMAKLLNGEGDSDLTDGRSRPRASASGRHPQVGARTPLSSRREQPERVRGRDGVLAPGHAELAQDRADMVLDGLRGEEEPP